VFPACHQHINPVIIQQVLLLTLQIHLQERIPRNTDTPNVWKNAHFNTIGNNENQPRDKVHWPSLSCE
jgi:hypothetical protein